MVPTACGVRSDRSFSGAGINTDPIRHPDPHSLDANRPQVPNLTFGDGPHVCIGAQLALLEAHALLDVLGWAFPEARLAVPLNEIERDPPRTQSRRLATLPTWLRGSAPGSG